MAEAPLDIQIGVLTLCDRDEQGSDRDAFFTAQEKAQTWRSKYKSLAYINSSAYGFHRTVSGWSVSEMWFGHVVLDNRNATALALRIARAIGFEFSTHPRLDNKILGAGSYNACHAESQLMAYILDRCYSTGPSKPSMKCIESIEINIHPRAVCASCHAFATYTYLTTGIEFVLYLNGKRDKPKCAQCKAVIEPGYICKNTKCLRRNLKQAMEDVDTARNAVVRVSKRCHKAIEDADKILVAIEGLLHLSRRSHHSL